MGDVGARVPVGGEEARVCSRLWKHDTWSGVLFCLTAAWKISQPTSEVGVSTLLMLNSSRWVCFVPATAAAAATLHGAVACSVQRAVQSATNGLSSLSVSRILIFPTADFRAATHVTRARVCVSF